MIAVHDHVSVVVGPFSGQFGVVVSVLPDGWITIRMEYGGEVQIESRKCRRV